MKVILVGGGIGGLTAAIALRTQGIEAQIYERSPALTEVGAGISLWPNAVKVLRKLGLEEKLRSISPETEDFALRRWNGAFISRTPARELERRFGGGMLLLHRAELLDVLAKSFGHSNLHLDHCCVGIEEDADGVTARFSNGDAARGDVLIGADGLHSAVRSWLGHDDTVRYSGYTAWRSVVDFDTSAIVAAETWGHGKRFGIHPLKNGRVYWWATANVPEGQDNQDQHPADTLLSLFKGWYEPVGSLVRASSGSKILRNDVYDRDPLPHWGRGRVTLLGDAAHPMTPNLGQGACQAIEDAEELALRLAREPNAAVALRKYETARIARTTSIVLASRRFGVLGQVRTPALCRMRDLLLGLIPSGVSLRSLIPTVGYERKAND